MFWESFLYFDKFFVWSIKWYQFIASHTPSFIWFSNVGKCSAGTGHSRDLPVFSFFCIFWWNIHNMGPIWPLHQYPRRQNQKYNVHFQVIGLELRALCLCISGNILLQDFYQNHFKLSVFLSNYLECSLLNLPSPSLSAFANIFWICRWRIELNLI